jgi:hypothetical protein
MRLFKTHEKDFAFFKSKNLKYIAKLANIIIRYKRFSFHATYENCIITEIFCGHQKNPIIYGNESSVFYLQFLTCDNELKNVVINSLDVDVLIRLI